MTAAAWTWAETSARRLSAATGSALVFRCVAQVDREAKRPMVATASAETASVGTGLSRISPPGSEPGACSAFVL
jgi:hypothetical protein